MRINTVRKGKSDFSLSLSPKEHMSGKELRLKRIMDTRSNRTIIIPVDHGATLGPVDHINNISRFLCDLDDEYVNGVVVCKGQMVNREIIDNCRIPKIVHLSNAPMISSQADYKILVGSVENAITLGADAISVHVNIGDEYDSQMLRDFGKVSDDCFKWGMPLLAMMYAKKNHCNDTKTQTIKLLTRMAQEMGADIVKVNYTGSVETFHEVVEGCSIPVIIAGGDYSDENHAIETARDAIKAGASGIAYGRNIFQNNNYKELIKKLSSIVHFGN